MSAYYKFSEKGDRQFDKLAWKNRKGCFISRRKYDIISPTLERNVKKTKKKKKKMASFPVERVGMIYVCSDTVTVHKPEQPSWPAWDVLPQWLWRRVTPALRQNNRGELCLESVARTGTRTVYDGWQTTGDTDSGQAGPGGGGGHPLTTRYLTLGSAATMARLSWYCWSDRWDWCRWWAMIERSSARYRPMYMTNSCYS